MGCLSYARKKRKKKKGGFCGDFQALQGRYGPKQTGSLMGTDGDETQIEYTHVYTHFLTHTQHLKLRCRPNHTRPEQRVAEGIGIDK